MRTPSVSLIFSKQQQAAASSSQQQPASSNVVKSLANVRCWKLPETEAR